MTMQQDSLSMTPPSSPLMQTTFGGILDDRLDDVMDLPGDDVAEICSDDAVCFCCLGKVTPRSNKCHPAGFLQRGVLDNLYKAGPEVSVKGDNAVVELFGAEFCATTALREELDALFFTARQQISSLEMQADSSGSADDMLSVRRSLRHFFDYVIFHINRYECEFVAAVVDHVRGIMLHIGQLNELHHNVLVQAPSSMANQSTSAGHHVFHMHLEVHWAVIEVLHHLSSKYPAVLDQITVCRNPSTLESIDGDMFYQAAYMLMSDVTALACRRYNQLSAQELASSHGVEAFDCACVRELCVMLRHVMHFRQERLAKESLLLIVQRVIHDVIRDVTKATPLIDMTADIDSDVLVLPTYNCRDALGFAWWLLRHLVTVFRFDILGVLTSGLVARAQGLQFIVHDLVKRTCTVPEGQMRGHLRLLLAISTSLPANVQVVTTLWEIFYKRLNDHFRISAGHVTDIQPIVGASSQLLDQSQAIVRNDARSAASANSYILFLHLLCVELQKSDKTGAANPEWRSVKGRLYSKFHSRRMQELSELGLQNFGLLFLCLAQVADTEELVGKLCEHYSSLSVASLETRKRMMVWRGSFAAMLLYCERGLDVAFLADKLVLSLNAVASTLSDPGLEPSRYSDLWRLVELYTESTQEVVELSARLDLHQHVLLGAGYQQILAVCRESHLRYLMHFALAVLTKLRLVCRGSTGVGQQGDRSPNTALSDALWSNFYPFTKQHSCTQTPPPLVADLAAGFTLLCAAVPPSVNSGAHESLAGVFSFFAWNEQVNAKVSCRFLGHMLPNADVMNRLGNVLHGNVDVETNTVKAWIRCAWQLLPDNQEMQQLSRLAEKLPCVLALQRHPAEEAETPLLQFFERLGHKYHACQDLKSRLEVREEASRYLSDVSKQLPALLANCASSEQTYVMYVTAGHMVKHCACLLYVKGKPGCLLPVLLDKLLLPRSQLLHGKQLPAHLMTAVKKTLHHFVLGLGLLDYKRDQYIQRKLREIVTYYLPRFSLSGSELAQSVTSVHPLLVAMDATFWRDVTEQAAQYRAFLLGLVKSEHLALKGVTAPQTAAAGWQWITECEKRTVSQSQVAKDSLVLLRTCLDYMLVVDNPALKQKAGRVLQYLLEAVSDQPQAVDRSTLGGILRAFVQSQLGPYQARVLRTLETVAVLCPSVVVPCVPVMTETIRAAEVKRGVGVDKQLRVCYYNVLNHLGETGKLEKTRLLSST